MGTIQRNSEFEKLTTTQKGNIGESVVREFLESKNFVCYVPITEKAHAFDFLAIRDKTQAIAAEVKTKARMSCYPATGFDERNYKYYKEFSLKHKIPIFIFFVDEHTGKVYGNWLAVLEKPCIVEDKQYPMIIQTRNGRNIRIYPLCKMCAIADLNNETIERLKQLSTRNYEYPEL